MQTPSGRRWQDHPKMISPDYRSSIARGAGEAPIKVDGWDGSLTLRPVWPFVPEGDADLTTNARVNGDPIGERLLIEGVLTDEDGRPVPGALIEIWQANAAGRYVHREEHHPAPLDPNFQGAGRTITGHDGTYRLITIKPGSYPWGNHRNAWRPAHIHFAVFGVGIAQRLITQMYFPADPTLPYDPIFNATANAEVRNRLISRFSMEDTIPNWAHCYKFDICLGGSAATPFEEGHDHG